MVDQAYKTDDSRGGQPLLEQHSYRRSQENRQRPLLKQLPLAAGIAGGLLLGAVIAYWLASGPAAMAFSEWLKVLIVPLVLAVSAYLFNRSLKERELRIADQQAQDGALQSYLEYMATMLMEKQLRHKGRDDEESICARAGTLLALRRLSPERKRNLLLFLCETGLIRKLPNIRGDSTPALDLWDADLKKIDLSGCTLPDVALANTNLSDANLSNTGLRGANLKGANLRRANLEGADLTPAEDGTATDLEGADLSDASLHHAKVTYEQLDAAKSLKGATMPDGSKRP